MIQPIGKNVVATIEETANVTSAGIFVGGTSAVKLAPKVALVMGVGDEVTKVKKGDRVVFKPYATYDVKEEKKESVMLEEIDILGIIVADK